MKDNLHFSELNIPLNNLEEPDLDDKEKQELSKKIVLPPVNKLKTMIDDLYSKEKKYVR